MHRKLVTCCIVILSAGCLVSCRTTEVSTSQQQQEQWLAKGYRHDANGWIFLHTEGGPFERGFQRGYLTANEIDEFLRTLAYTQEFETGLKPDYFVRAASRLFKGKVPAEYVEEMRGIAAGMQHAGKKATYEQVLYMNGFIDILWYWWPKEKHRLRDDHPGCSAFIATGDATAGGKIVMAHNSWCPYWLGKSANIILDIVPQSGHRILMQTWGPCIYSATDFFITDAGLIGTETTIGDFEGFNAKRVPVFVRARKAMQYADSIDEWADILIKDNNGAYANSWLLGRHPDRRDRLPGARPEISQPREKEERVFHRLECHGEYPDPETGDDGDLGRHHETSAVSRRVRWNQLMKEHFGRIDASLARQMLADHYDTYLQKEQPGSRTICGHFELDDGSVPGTGRAFRPSGAFDGKVVDSDMAKAWRFWAKWGGSCDTGFNAADFLQKHPQYDWLQGHLPDMPPKPWTVFPPEQTDSSSRNP